MKLPRAFLDEVLARIDIVEVIEQRTTLKKTGQANYQGLCPFHQEKSPSFSVSQSKQFYHCFGCKASGNAIGFLIAYDKLPFIDAVEILAGKAGLSLPENTGGPLPDEANLNVVQQCANYYETQLKKNVMAQRYLADRGLTPDIVARFHIGFAPPGWQNLVQNVSKHKTAQNHLLATGMIIAKDTKLFDRFRHRIMFPIHNSRGQVIAFGGRSIDQQMPKYLNSPENELFHKSKVLYGLYQALQSNKKIDQVIIVEGYMDVVSLHQYGITTAVATLGTAISTGHVYTLLRLTNQLLFCFDGDSAGHTAAWRALEIVLPLMNEGMQVKFLFLPDKEDPDSFVRKNGQAGMLQQMTNAVSLTDFFFNRLANLTETETIAGKTKYVQLADKMLNPLPKGIFQELMYQRLAQIVGLDQDKIFELTRRIEAPLPPPNVSYDADIPGPVRFAASLLIQAPHLEQVITLPVEFATIPLPGIGLINKIVAILKQNPGQTTGRLLEHFQDQEQQLVSQLAAQEILIPIEGWENELKATLDRILTINVEETITALFTKGGKLGLSDKEKMQLQQLLSNRK